MLAAAAQQPPSWLAVEQESILYPPPTPFIGRSAEMAELQDWLARPGIRLITVTGAPGVGKTRLAQEVCAVAGADCDRVFGVPLAALTDHGAVAAAICRTLGVREQPRQRPMDTIVAYCQGRRLLVMLDTFEHVSDAAQLLADLVSRCQGLRLLVTSRAAVRIRGEHVFALEPLPVPDPDPEAPRILDALAAVPSVALFLERAHAAAPSFELTASNAGAVAAICRRLDGLPLALELVAPWVRMLTPDAVLDRLRTRLDPPVEGPRDVPERHRTIEATLAWSCDLLHEEERALLRRLSVFAGGAPIDAVATICQAAAPLSEGVTRLLGVLADQHLVRREVDVHDRQRISMLETVRGYGRALLREAGEAEATHRAHAAAFGQLVLDAEPELIGPSQASWFLRLVVELDNVRAALDWAEERGELELGLRTASRLTTFWETRGQWREGLDRIERLLARAGAVPPAVRARAQEAAGLLAAREGDVALSRRRHEESLALFTELEDRRGVGAALHGLGLLNLWENELPQARELLEQALAIHTDNGDRYGAAVSLNVLGAVVSEQRDEARALELYEASRALHEELGNRVGMARSLLNIGVSARRIRELDRSARSLERAVAIARDLDVPELLGSALVNLGNASRSAGDVGAARSQYAESLRILLRIADHRWIAYALECVGLLAREEGQLAVATRLYGAAGGLRDRFGMRGWPVTWSEHREALQALREEVDQATFAAGYAEGAELSTALAVAEAIDWLDR